MPAQKSSVRAGAKLTTAVISDYPSHSTARVAGVLKHSCNVCGSPMPQPSASDAENVRCGTCNAIVSPHLSVRNEEVQLSAPPPISPKNIISPPSQLAGDSVRSPAVTKRPPPPSVPMTPRSRPPSKVVSSTTDEGLCDTGSNSDPLWFVRSEDGQEFGPITKNELDVWVVEDRLTPHFQVLQVGRGQWRCASDIYPVLRRSASRVEVHHHHYDRDTIPAPATVSHPSQREVSLHPQRSATTISSAPLSSPQAAALVPTRQTQMARHVDRPLPVVPVGPIRVVKHPRRSWAAWLLAGALLIIVTVPLWLINSADRSTLPQASPPASRNTADNASSQPQLPSTKPYVVPADKPSNVKNVVSRPHRSATPATSATTEDRRSRPSTSSNVNSSASTLQPNEASSNQGVGFSDYSASAEHGYPSSSSTRLHHDTRSEKINTVGMRLRLIPAGEFVMGCDDSSDTRPQHRVKIGRPFYLGIHEVTQAQYRQITGSSPSNFKDDHLPVEQVSWHDTVNFCNQLSLRERKNYRLPTEAEWEYACRAGSTDAYCFGHDPAQLREFAWYEDNSSYRTHPVGLKQPSGWGLYDMHGNVSEWCHDWYLPTYYVDAQKESPRGPMSGSRRVIRGGGWDRNPFCCRSTYRDSKAPTHRYVGLGFRVVCEH